MVQRYNMPQNNKSKKSIDRLMIILSSLFVALSLILSTYSSGKFALLGIAALGLLIPAAVNNWRIPICFDSYHKKVFLFSIFCLATAIWSIDSYSTVSNSLTLFQIVICVYPFYAYFKKNENPMALIDSIMWGGYIVALYTFYYFGPSKVLYFLANNQRLPDGFENSNSIGMVVAYAVVIAFYKLICEKPRLHMLLCIPSFMVIAASGSRKALVLMVLGILMVFVLKMLYEGNIVAFIKFVFGSIIIVIVLYYLLNLPMFSFVLGRLEDMIKVYTGQSTVDNSTVVRLKMIEIGKEMFINSPIVGNGFKSSATILLKQIGEATYLHNNYIEILASGGILGFILYYGIYFSALSTLLKRRKSKIKGDVLIMSILLLRLIMDYGAVTYYSKTTFVLFGAIFVYLAVTNPKEKKPI